MSDMREVATVTSKGQITLPKPIRKALSVAVGGKVAFDLRQGEVIVSCADDAEHQDPAIEAFLGVLERDIGAGKHVQAFAMTQGQRSSCSRGSTTKGRCVRRVASPTLRSVREDATPRKPARRRGGSCRKEPFCLVPLSAELRRLTAPATMTSSNNV